MALDGMVLQNHGICHCIKQLKMSDHIYIQNESKKCFKEWTIEGLSFLLQHKAWKTNREFTNY